MPTFAKAYGIKVRCYGEHVRNTLATWGTYKEPIGNLKGAEWIHIGNEGKMKKNPFPFVQE
jgi:hypothetical protein